MEFSETGDAELWAEAFIEHAGDDPAGFATDMGNLIGWFANAIERGKQIGRDAAFVELTGATEAEHFLERFNAGEIKNVGHVQARVVDSNPEDHVHWTSWELFHDGHVEDDE